MASDQGELRQQAAAPAPETPETVAERINIIMRWGDRPEISCHVRLMGTDQDIVWLDYGASLVAELLAKRPRLAELMGVRTKDGYPTSAAQPARQQPAQQDAQGSRAGSRGRSGGGGGGGGSRGSQRASGRSRRGTRDDRYDADRPECPDCGSYMRFVNINGGFFVCRDDEDHRKVDLEDWES